MLGYHSIERGTFRPLQFKAKLPHKKQIITTQKNAYVPQINANVAITRPHKTVFPSAHLNSQIQRNTNDRLLVDLISTVNQLYDSINKSEQRVERDVSDLRQQQSLLVHRRDEESAEISNIISELSSLKQRLLKTMSHAESQLHAMEKSCIPAQLQKEMNQLKIECNWFYARVMVKKLYYYVSPTTTIQPTGNYLANEKILVLYKTIENEEGLWMQIRIPNDPEKRFWIRLIDGNENVTLGQFTIC